MARRPSDFGSAGTAELHGGPAQPRTEGGYYHLVAVLRDEEGVAGRASRVVTLVFRD